MSVEWATSFLDDPQSRYAVRDVLNAESAVAVGVLIARRATVSLEQHNHSCYRATKGCTSTSACINLNPSLGHQH